MATLLDMFFVFGVSLCDLILNKCKEGWFAIQTMGKIWIDSKVRNQKRSQHSDTNTSNNKCNYKINTICTKTCKKVEITWRADHAVYAYVQRKRQRQRQERETETLGAIQRFSDLVTDNQRVIRILASFLQFNMVQSLCPCDKSLLMKIPS